MTSSAGNGDAPIPVADAGAVARAFAQRGAVHVSGAVDAGILRAIRAASERVFRGWDELHAAGRLPEALAAAQERRYVPLSQLDPGFAVAGAVLHPAFRTLARAYLDTEPEVDPNSHVRWIGPGRGDAHLPFHQDQTILGRALLNVWIPLDACGTTSPGLEVVAGSWRRLLEPAPSEGARFPVERARLAQDEVLGAFGPEALWHPSFAPGDAMLFSGATIHRTYALPAMTGDRISIEIRLL